MGLFGLGTIVTTTLGATKYHNKTEPKKVGKENHSDDG